MHEVSPFYERNGKLEQVLVWVHLEYYDPNECVPSGIAALNHTFFRDIICIKVSKALTLRFPFVSG